MFIYNSCYLLFYFYLLNNNDNKVGAKVDEIIDVSAKQSGNTCWQAPAGSTWTDLLPEWLPECYLALETLTAYIMWHPPPTRLPFLRAWVLFCRCSWRKCTRCHAPLADSCHKARNMIGKLFADFRRRWANTRKGSPTSGRSPQDATRPLPMNIIFPNHYGLKISKQSYPEYSDTRHAAQDTRSWGNKMRMDGSTPRAGVPLGFHQVGKNRCDMLSSRRLLFFHVFDFVLFCELFSCLNDRKKKRVRCEVYFWM